MEDRQYYRLLKQKMILIMIFVSFTPLILISGIIGYYFETSYRDKVLAHLKEVVLRHQQSINIFLNEKLSYLRVLADTYPPEQLSDELFLRKKLAILQSAYAGVFVDLGVVNAQGLQVAYAGTFKLERADYSQADWFREAMKRTVYISDVFLGLRRQPHFIVSVKQTTAGKDWIVRAAINFEAFNSLVESIHIGKTGAAIILNQKGDFQTEPRSGSLADKESYLKILRNQVPENGKIITAEIREGDHPITAPVMTAGQVDHGGKKIIYVMTPLKNGEWILVYQQEAADAFSDLRRARQLALFIFLIGGLSIVSAAVVLSRRMVRRIERANREKEMLNEKVIEAGKLASIGELAAGIAHEINNPVAVMVEEVGWIEDLLEEKELLVSSNLAEFERALKQIKTQGARCKEITHKLLSFARKTDPTVKEVRLNDLLEEIVAISEQMAKYGNVKMVKNFAAELPLLAVSPSEMQQVFLNLINNAIDAIGADGGTVEIATRMDGNYVIVDVADTGPGIPKEILPRIFDPFFTTKPVGKGTGLGLSICYGIIQKMGGDIRVNSAVGLGTTFHVHVPLPQNSNGREDSQ